MKALVVDDEKLIVKGLKFSLEQEGYEVDCAYDGQEAVDKCKEKEYDIVLLDLMLPILSGYEVCQQVREFSDMPIIMLTAKGDDMDKILGLEYGADDYITKPFGVMELVSRTKAVLRRTVKKVKTVLVYKNIEIDENKHTVLVDGAEIDLTYKEYEILKHLIRNKGIVLTRDRLMEIVWGYNFEQGNRTVDVHIQSLRKKLGIAGEHIKTIRNVGYKVGE